MSNPQQPGPPAGWQPTPPPPPPLASGPPPPPSHPGGPAWSPAPPPPLRTGRSGGGRELASVITIAVSGLIALALLATADSAGDAVTTSYFWVQVTGLAAAVAPIALLVSAGEFDLAPIGAVSLASYVFAEIANDDRTLLGAVVALALGALGGAIIGVVRFLTREPSAMVSLVAGLVAVGVFGKLSGAEGVRVGERVNNTVLIVVALLIVAVVAGFGVAVATSQTPVSADPTPPSWTIAGFALSGLGTAYFAVAVTSASGFAGGGIGLTVVLLIFGAVAIGGVGLGSSRTAAVTAAIGALVVIAVDRAVLLHRWDDWNVLLISLLAAMSLMVGGAVRRAAG